MLTITIHGSDERELWDERNETFVWIPAIKGQTIQLEHSLLSVSKWESKWHKAFLGPQPKTNEEIIDYVRCMTVTQNVDPRLYSNLTTENITEINQYIENPMTATTFAKQSSNRKNRDIPTSELIYYWMVAQQIPFECQKWHLNRLLTLIRICGIKNSTDEKRGRGEIIRDYAAINEARRKKLQSRG